MQHDIQRHDPAQPGASIRCPSWRKGISRLQPLLLIFGGEKIDGLALESREEVLGYSRYSVFVTHVYIFKGWFRKCLQTES